MRSQTSLYASPSLPYTACEAILRLHPNIHPYVRALAFACLLTHVVVSCSQAPQPPQSPAEQTTPRSSTPAEPQNTAHIALLATLIHVDANGGIHNYVNS